MNRLFLIGMGALMFAVPAQAATLNVHLEGVRAAGGTLYVSVQTREQFMGESGTAGTVVAAPREGAHDFSFDVPPGEYAVSVWHDDNGNSRFDTSESHMPLDGWAMSNGESLRGEPSFDQVRMQIGNTPASVRLNMSYGR